MLSIQVTLHHRTHTCKRPKWQEIYNCSTSCLQLYARTLTRPRWQKTIAVNDRYPTKRSALSQSFKLYEYNSVPSAVRAHVHMSVSTLNNLPIIFSLISRCAIKQNYTKFFWIMKHSAAASFHTAHGYNRISSYCPTSPYILRIS